MGRRSYNKLKDMRLPNAVQDYDGNWYDAVILGDQVWLGSNLKTTHYADGTSLEITDRKVSQTVAYCYQLSNADLPTNERTFYNGCAVMGSESNSSANPSGVQGISPTGWHIPSGAEWEQLSNYLKSKSRYVLYQDFNGKHIAKALASTSYWKDGEYSEGDVAYNQTENNKARFSIYPVGYVQSNGNQTVVGSDFRTRSVFMISQKTTTAGGYFRGVYITAGGKDIYVGDIAFSGYNAGSVRCVCNMNAKQFIRWYYNQYGSFNHQIS